MDCFSLDNFIHININTLDSHVNHYEWICHQMFNFILIFRPVLLILIFPIKIHSAIYISIETGFQSVISTRKGVLYKERDISCLQTILMRNLAKYLWLNHCQRQIKENTKNVHGPVSMVLLKVHVYGRWFYSVENIV